MNNTEHRVPGRTHVLRSGRIEAYARQEETDFVVLKGSSIRAGTGNKTFVERHPPLQELRTQLVDESKLVERDGLLMLHEDVKFASGHKAASFVLASDESQRVWRRFLDEATESPSDAAVNSPGAVPEAKVAGTEQVEATDTVERKKRYSLKTGKSDAIGCEEGELFVVLKGSKIREFGNNVTFTKTGKHGALFEWRANLEATGSLKPEDGALVLQDDLEFKSMHKAASFVLASDTASTVWKLEKDPEVAGRVKQFVETYQSMKDRYEGLEEQLRDRLEESLTDPGLNDSIAFTLQSRTKSESSLGGKLENRFDEKLDYYGALSDIPDLAGVRVLVYEPLKVPAILELITAALNRHRDGESFALVRAPELNDWERKETDIDNDDWYCASHLTVTYVDGVGGSQLTCEIQVTDIMSHVINEIGHDLVYKDQAASSEAEKKKSKNEDMDVARMKEAFRALFNNLQSAQDAVARVSVLATEVSKA